MTRKTRFAKPEITPELKAAVEALIVTKAYVAAIRPVVEGYQREILSRRQFPYSRAIAQRYIKRGGVVPAFVAEPKETYMMTKRDFRSYLAELRRAQAEAGFKVKKDECPLLVAEYDQIKAEWAVLKAGQYVFDAVCIKAGHAPVDLMEVYNMDIRRGILDTIVGLTLSLTNINAADLVAK
jgi:hypothetical protein